MHHRRLFDLSGVTADDLNLEHLADLLQRLSHDDLRDICRDLGLAVSGPNKDVLVDRILKRADLGRLLEVVPKHEYHGGYRYVYLFRCDDHPLLECASEEALTGYLQKCDLVPYLNSLDHIRDRETGLVFITMDEDRAKVYFQYVEYKTVLRLTPQGAEDGPLQLLPESRRYPVVIVVSQQHKLVQVRLNGYTYKPGADPVDTSDYAEDVRRYLGDFMTRTGMRVSPLEWRPIVSSLASGEGGRLLFTQKDFLPAVGGYLVFRNKDEGLVAFLRRLEERIKQRIRAQSPQVPLDFDLVQIVDEIESDSDMPRVQLVSLDGRTRVKVNLNPGAEFVHFGASPEEKDVDYVVDAIAACL